MSILFLDSSALTKRYVTEQGSNWVIASTDTFTKNTIIVADITRVEVAAAFAARQRAGSITLHERDALVTLLLHHCNAEYQMVAIAPALTGNAVDLTQRHRLRGYDSVQLAAALGAAAVLPNLIFVAADHDLLVAARAEGLAIENPNDHP